jgi:hypothetical protein
MTRRLHFCNLGLEAIRRRRKSRIVTSRSSTSGGVFFLGELCYNLIPEGRVLRLVA